MLCAWTCTAVEEFNAMVRANKRAYGESDAIKKLADGVWVAMVGGDKFFTAESRHHIQNMQRLGGR